MRARDIVAVGIDAAGAFVVAGGRRIATVELGRFVALDRAPSEARVAALAGLPDGRLLAADASACVLYEAAPNAEWTIVAGAPQALDLDRRPRRVDGTA